MSHVIIIIFFLLMKWLQIAIKSTSIQIERSKLLAIGVLMTEIDYKGKQNAVN